MEFNQCGFVKKSPPRLLSAVRVGASDDARWRDIEGDVCHNDWYSLHGVPQRAEVINRLDVIDIQAEARRH